VKYERGALVGATDGERNGGGKHGPEITALDTPPPPISCGCEAMGETTSPKLSEEGGGGMRLAAKAVG